MTEMMKSIIPMETMSKAMQLLYSTNVGVRAEVRWGSLTSLIANLREPRWLHKFLAEDNKRLVRQIITGHLCQVR